jgi:hypothetical protein
MLFDQSLPSIYNELIIKRNIPSEKCCIALASLGNMSRYIALASSGNTPSILPLQAQAKHHFSDGIFLCIALHN